MRMTSCGTPDCLACKVSNTPCPPESRLFPKDFVCFMRSEQGVCEHTTAMYEAILDVERPRN